MVIVLVVLVVLVLILVVLAAVTDDGRPLKNPAAPQMGRKEEH